MDLGLSKLITPALEWLCEQIGQYGLAIIVATVILRLLILPLDIIQRKGSLKMQALSPKVQEINKRFANDPQKRQQATQQLYKKEGVNTLSGCLPLLIQLPFFVGFFNAMRSIAYQTTNSFYELAAAGDSEGFAKLLSRCRFLWIGNVFQPDAMFTISLKSLFGGNQTVVSILPTASEAAIAFKQLGLAVTESQYTSVMADYLAKYNVRTNGLFIIAVFAGLASYFQQKTMPQTNSDPDQQGTMKGMMIFMTCFSVYLCCTYNAAFGLYYMVTMAMGMGLQMVLKKIYTPERLARKRGVDMDNTFPDRKKKREAQKEVSAK